MKTIVCTTMSCLQTHLMTTASDAPSARGGHTTNVPESMKETTVSHVNCVEDIIGSVWES